MNDIGLVSGIEYFKTDEVYTTDIFTIPNFKYNLTKDTMSVQKHIYDYEIAYDCVSNYGELVDKVLR